MIQRSDHAYWNIGSRPFLVEVFFKILRFFPELIVFQKFRQPWIKEVCTDIEEDKCIDVPETKCEDVTRTIVETKYDEECLTFNEKVCETEFQKKCQKEPLEICIDFNHR